MPTTFYNVPLENVVGMYQSWQNVAVRAASETGISVVESVGTIELIDLPPRLGSDHILSMMRIFPERTLGFEVDWPERIVRISTSVLHAPDEGANVARLPTFRARPLGHCVRSANEPNPVAFRTNPLYAAVVRDLRGPCVRGGSAAQHRIL